MGTLSKRYSFLIRYCRKCAIHLRHVLLAVAGVPSHYVIADLDKGASEADPVDGGRGRQLHDDVGVRFDIVAVFAVESARVEDLLAIDDLVDLLPECGRLLLPDTFMGTFGSDACYS